MKRATSFQVNGSPVHVAVSPLDRLSQVLRNQLGLTGTKIGCDAGDCGACTVLVDGKPVCACLMAAGQLEGRSVTTVEGLGACSHSFRPLREAFLRHGAAQCGICTPGMLVSAVALLDSVEKPKRVSERDVLDALGGVLCRCTGYRKIVSAVLDAAGEECKEKAAEEEAHGDPALSVGKRLIRVDGARKVDGAEIFGADEFPADALVLTAIRSPYAHARFCFGDLDAYVAAMPGIQGVFTARDVPGRNTFGVLYDFIDQPVFAEQEARFRGEAVAAVVGEPEAMAAFDLRTFPVTWEELLPLTTIDQAAAADAPRIHAKRAGNFLSGARVVRGDVEAGLRQAHVVVESVFDTGFVEHAYIEPEAGFARRVGDRIEIQACTQSPYMDLHAIAAIMNLEHDAVRIIPTAVGGGFGSKLDLSVQPLLAIAAWHLRRPVRMVYTRPESMMATTKRHPAHIRLRAGAARDGRLVALDFAAEFNTGAYASWGPTVTNRVPVHAAGPYKMPHYRAVTSAVHTHLVPGGAFRGFGVPQATAAVEQAYDELAEGLGIDPLEFRILNALDETASTVTGQVLGESTGILACLEALRPRWRQARAAAEIANVESAGPLRRGAGVAAAWYGCGNTSLPNPSTMRIGLKADGRFVLHQGAVDIGQGSNTVIAQICAESLGVAMAELDLVLGDTDKTPDGGKTSASRQTFVTGKAVSLAACKMRQCILDQAGMPASARLLFEPGHVVVEEADRRVRICLRDMPLDRHGYVLTAEATFDPPTRKLDGDGQGTPYATYGFGAHIAEVEVDVELGTVRVLRITAAHDTGRTINPTLAEGQIEGGAAQGLGFALMEEFFPGRGENLHDYLIPTIGDMPPVESILLEIPSPFGPFGAKGLGEHTLIPTAPAIMNAIYHATGVRVRRIPATPDRLRKALLSAAVTEASHA